ncbi:hypothetical protein [Corynebacterium sp. ACRQP]|uniref:hypothetical protein n=1 Tax=Corynebacterium sp. ACRQP TaxID=2918195 RepID=UPI001EF63F70|nr:hypothetical protein [Corynebacterium sp. ACRQP]MCG7235705.1 hypothetical protein [Corynebacterium sp. ACRQP]
MTSSASRRLLAFTTVVMLIAGGTLATRATGATQEAQEAELFFFDFAKLANGAQTQGGRILNGARTYTFTQADGLPNGMEATVSIREAAALARLSDYASMDVDGNEILTKTRLLAAPSTNPFFRGAPALTQYLP